MSVICEKCNVEMIGMPETILLNEDHCYEGFYCYICHESKIVEVW